MGRRGSNLASTVGIGSLTSCFLEREMWRFLKLSFVGTLSRGEKATAGAFLRCRKESLHLLKLMIPWSYPRATPWATWIFLFRMQRWSAMLDLFFFHHPLRAFLTYRTLLSQTLDPSLHVLSPHVLSSHCIDRAWRSFALPIISMSLLFSSVVAELHCTVKKRRSEPVWIE